MADQLSITHNVCGKTSYNQNDVAKKYCAECHIFMAEGTYTITEDFMDLLRVQQTVFYLIQKNKRIQ